MKRLALALALGALALIACAAPQGTRTEAYAASSAPKCDFGKQNKKLAELTKKIEQQAGTEARLPQAIAANAAALQAIADAGKAPDANADWARRIDCYRMSAVANHWLSAQAYYSDPAEAPAARQARLKSAAAALDALNAVSHDGRSACDSARATNHQPNARDCAWLAFFSDVTSADSAALALRTASLTPGTPENLAAWGALLSAANTFGEQARTRWSESAALFSAAAQAGMSEVADDDADRRALLTRMTCRFSVAGAVIAVRRPAPEAAEAAAQFYTAFNAAAADASTAIPLALPATTPPTPNVCAAGAPAAACQRARLDAISAACRVLKPRGAPAL